RQAHRMSGHAVYGEPDLLDRSTGFHDRRRNVHEREIPNGAVPNLFEIKLRTGPCRWDSNGSEQIAGLQDGHFRDVDRWTDEIIFGVHHALALGRSDNKFCVESNQSRRRVGWIDRDAAVSVQDGVLAIEACRSIGVANVAPGAITRPATSVIPATGILGDVAAD